MDVRLVLLLALASACQTHSIGPRGDASSDASAVSDARVLDGKRDASTPRDAEPSRDSEMPRDSGTSYDAASARDAGDGGGIEYACGDHPCEFCTDGETKCDQNDLLTCRGTYFAGRQSCGDRAVCVVGPPARCEPSPCISGERQCFGNVLLDCPGGTFTQTDCGANATCKGTPARCVERFCTPSEKLCDGERSMVCNATGDGLDFVEDCAAASQSCVGAGVCKPKICHEGDLVCANGSVERCGMKGTAYGLFVLCDPTTQVCDDSSGSAQCVFACTPNAPVCDGNVLTTCAIDGKALNAGGVDCTATGEVCDPVSSACAPKTCEPHSTYCKNGNVYACVASGSTEMLFQACKASEYCREYPTQAAYCETDVCYAGQMTCTGSIARPCLADGSGFDFTTGTDCSTQDAQCYVNQCSPCGSTAHPANNYCVRDVCPQGAVTCNDNRIVTCKADGTGFNLVGTDCAMLGEICDQNRQCAMAAVDTIGTWINSNYDQQALVGNVYRVDSARHLTQIEMDIETPGSNPLAWVVYESSDGGQSFTKIAETTTLIVDPSIGLVNSGPISVPLVKGDYYTIGMYSPVAARLGQPQDFSSNLEMTSFGQVVGDRFWYYNENALTGYNSSARYFQQLTTVP